MKNNALLIILASASIATQTWQIAQPGYPYEFPRDHFSHPQYQTEWWYYTGNLRAADGHRYGFELTFFRQAQKLSAQTIASEAPAWRPEQMYLAHLALSDLDSGKFYHAERLHRAGPGLAGADLQQQRIWNGNWQVRWTWLDQAEQQLSAVGDPFTLTLDLVPAKPAVIQGQNGISRKGPLPGQASHYISFTRLSASGELEIGSTKRNVKGVAWMDHEFFTEPRASDLQGWDWFAIQLSNNEELMLYRLRGPHGAISPFSSGSYVDAHGHARFLSSNEFTLAPGATWTSPQTGARYPIAWQIGVPSLGLELNETTALKDQEIWESHAVTPAYWEGAVSYAGRWRNAPVSGVGYLELTGYQKPVTLSGSGQRPQR